ncbi:MAG: patatin-like phospholipase family protein [Alkalispirochaeta sp.]
MGIFRREPPRIGLALGGGAARGIAHIGVLKVIEEAGLPISAVAGTSVGSIVGALMAAGLSWREIYEVSRNIGWSKLLQLSFSGLGIVKTSRLETLVEEIVGDRNIEDLSIPFAAIAVDIGTFEEVVFTSGPVARAVRASSSIPGIFEPVMDGDRALVDGGVTNNLPTDHTRALGATTVIAVELNAHMESQGPPANLFDVSYRSFAALMLNTSREGRADADVLIEPAIGHIMYHDLGKAQELFDAGEEAARRVLARHRLI